MKELMLHSLGALAGLVPFLVYTLRWDPGERSPVRWILLGVAFCGAASVAWAANNVGWNPGLAATLWVSIAASLAVFAVLAARVSAAWRLGRVLMPYLLVLGLLATVWSGTEGAASLDTPGPWLIIHVTVAVTAFALATVAAVAATGTFIQERALKSRNPGPLSRSLPSVADGERIQTRLLILAETVLLIGILSGMAELYVSESRLATFDHKTILSVLAFLLIGLLLFLQAKSGLRGRRAARLLLLSYLLITLAYPGVKFVTDVILA